MQKRRPLLTPKDESHPDDDASFLAAFESRCLSSWGHEIMVSGVLGVSHMLV